VDGDVLKRVGVVDPSVDPLAGDVREMKGILRSLSAESGVESVRTEIEKLRIDITRRCDAL
jgi:hypothetical protein